MPYAILRFQKRKAGSVAACERHNERKKEAYKSNPDIDMERSRENYHLVAPPRYTYKKEINRMTAAAGPGAPGQRDAGGNAHHSVPGVYEQSTTGGAEGLFCGGAGFYF